MDHTDIQYDRKDFEMCRKSNEGHLGSRTGSLCKVASIIVEKVCSVILNSDRLGVEIQYVGCNAATFTYHSFNSV